MHYWAQNTCYCLCWFSLVLPCIATESSHMLSFEKYLAVPFLFFNPRSSAGEVQLHDLWGKWHIVFMSLILTALTWHIHQHPPASATTIKINFLLAVVFIHVLKFQWSNNAIQMPCIVLAKDWRRENNTMCYPL